MITNPTIITDEEIAQYRQQLADYPEALDALDLIAECDGNLEESANFLVIEEGISELRSGESEEENTLDKIAKKFRKIICDDDFIDDLMSDLVTAGIASLAVSGQIPVAVATPVVIYLAKKGVKSWCNSN